MGRPRKVPTTEELNTTPTTFRAMNSLTEDFAIFCAYIGAQPAEIHRQAMREFVAKNKANTKAMEYYDRKKGQMLITS